MKKRFISTTMVFVIIAACFFGASLAIYRELFMPNGRVVPAFSEGGMNVVIEGDVIEGMGEPRIIEDRIMIPLKIIKEFIDPEVNWDNKLHKLTITTTDRVIRMKTDSLEAYVNNKPVTLNLPVRETNASVLVPIDFLSGFYGIDISYIKGNNVVVIDFKNHMAQLAEPLDAKAVVRSGCSIFNPIVKRLDSKNADENKLRIFDELEKWYKVRTSDGMVGFIERKYVAAGMKVVSKSPSIETPKPEWSPQTGKLGMAWEYAYDIKIDLSKRKKIDGLDIISPTWFQVVGEDGAIKNSGDAKYVEWAHNNGYKVWALFGNNFGDPKKSSNFLRNTDSRDNAIRQLLVFTALYKLDGINFDFENLLESDKDALTQFVRELAPLLREQGVVFSLDINTLGCYDRKALGEIADYVIFMAYDQHWSGGSEAGSVAELKWVDRTISSFLTVIPNQKLILGIPFYTRLWQEAPGDGGKIELTSQALSMASANKVIRDNKAPVKWDEACGQFYSEFIKDGATCKVWLEEGNSLNLKTSLVQKYQLAGASAWRLDYELESVWPVIKNNLKTVKSYNEWGRLNAGKNYVFAN